MIINLKNPNLLSSKRKPDNMNLGKEFEKYAVKHRGISSASLHSYQQNGFTNLTPYIIEERPMNVASMDVFSRLMMDRIIFMGEGINDYVANIVTAQLLFLESTDRTQGYPDVHQQSRRRRVCRVGYI
jgi:hypothetical protein